MKEVTHYSTLHEGISLRDLPEPTVFIGAGEKLRAPSPWNNIIPEVAVVAAQILLFAHVRNLDEASGLLIDTNTSSFRRSDLLKDVQDWKDDAGKILIGNYTWLRGVSDLMSGSTSRDLPFDLKGVSLLSDRGWSAYVPTFGVPDPADLSKFTLHGQM